MADEQSTTEDTTVSEDTSTNEESALEDIEVSPEDISEEPEESGKNEETDTEPTEPEEQSEEDVEEQETEPQESEQDKQKRLNNEFAQRRIQEKAQRDQTQKQQQQEYLEQAEDDKDLALRQVQVDAYNNKVDRNTDKLTNGYEKAIKDFDILNSDDPIVKSEVDAAIDAFQAIYVTVDAYGNPTDVRGDLYKYLQSKADSISQLTGLKSTKQVNDKNKEKSKTSIIPSKAPKEPKEDPDLAAFDEEAKK